MKTLYILIALLMFGCATPDRRTAAQKRADNIPYYVDSEQGLKGLSKCTAFSVGSKERKDCFAHFADIAETHIRFRMSGGDPNRALDFVKIHQEENFDNIRESVISDLKDAEIPTDDDVVFYSCLISEFEIAMRHQHIRRETAIAKANEPQDNTMALLSTLAAVRDRNMHAYDNVHPVKTGGSYSSGNSSCTSTPNGAGGFVTRCR